VSALRNVREAVTEPISVEGRTDGLSEEVNVGPPNAAVRLKAPTRATISVEVVPAPVEWAVADVPVRVIGGTAVGAPVPPKVTLELRGPRELVTSEISDFDATVNIDGLRPGSVLVPVRVVAPNRVGVVKVNPAEVRVRIR